MQRASNFDLLPLDSEIERTFIRIREEKKNATLVMAAEDNNQNNQQRALRDYFKPLVDDNYSGIQRLTVNANNFELNPTLINMVQ